MDQVIEIKEEIKCIKIKTTPFADQKPGTSGLRKKTKVVMQDNYLENFIQSVLLSLRSDELAAYNILVAGGDGRYFNREALLKVVNVACGNGVDEVHIAAQGHMSTPAMSHYIRQLNNKQGNCLGGLILTASHNPGGIEQDFGIKFNVRNGGPAQEEFTNTTYAISTQIQHYKASHQCLGKWLDIDTPGNQYVFTNVHRPWKPTFTVKIVDGIKHYVELMQQLFNFPLLKQLVSRDDFYMLFDGMSGIAGPYAVEILHKQLGMKREYLQNCEVMQDFGGRHPDPNLTYAKDLADQLDVEGVEVDTQVVQGLPDVGGACDGDADRNMIIGKQFFVTPSDSLAILAANYSSFLKEKPRGVARSMPTSGAIDQVAKELDIPLYETPTGWKFFGNLMEDNLISICGEESFGTGSTHIREKDGLWAILAWLSILATHSQLAGHKVSVQSIVHAHWAKYGRNFYSRYDYEAVDTQDANNMFTHLKQQFQPWMQTEHGAMADVFDYTDPVDQSISKNQGIRFLLKDGSRIIFRLSGTGSVGATIRIYFEQYQKDKDKVLQKQSQALQHIIQIGLQLSQIEKFTGRTSPTVIT